MIGAITAIGKIAGPVMKCLDSFLQRRQALLGKKEEEAALAALEAEQLSALLNFVRLEVRANIDLLSCFRLKIAKGEDAPPHNDPCWMECERKLSNDILAMLYTTAIETPSILARLHNGNALVEQEPTETASETDKADEKEKITIMALASRCYRKIQAMKALADINPTGNALKDIRHDVRLRNLAADLRKLDKKLRTVELN